MNAPVAVDSPHKLLGTEYRDLAERMLEQWDIEMREGFGTPNILAGDRTPGGGEYGPRYAPQFSPLAERADLCLRDLQEKDRGDAQMLIDVVTGMSLNEIAKRLNVSKSQVQLWVEGCWCSFEMTIYYRNKLRAFPPRRPRKMLEGDL